MAPETVIRLVILDLANEEDHLVATRYSADSEERFLVKWYSIITPPVNYQAVAHGVVFVP